MSEDTNGKDPADAEAEAQGRQVAQNARALPPRTRAAMIQALLETYCRLCGHELRPWEQEGCSCSLYGEGAEGRIVS